LGVPTDKAGRVLVQPDLSIPGQPNVFVVGDLAAVANEEGVPVPGVAPAAIQMGKFVAKTILRDLKGEPRKRFVYLDKGSLATIGRSKAVGMVRKLHFSGRLAWMAWLLVHVFFLIGFRNRFFVILEWAWSYFTFQRNARLITGDLADLEKRAEAAGNQARSAD
jgi:NADH dehydrogenase